MSPRILPLLLLTAFVPGCGKKSAAPTAPPVAGVTVAKPILKKVTEWDEFVGRLESPKAVEIRPRVSGYLQEVHFREGGMVKEGDPLFTIDPRPYQSVVDRVTADLERAKSRVDLARSEAARATKLVETNAISSQEAETRAKALIEAEAAARSADAALASSKLDLEFTNIRAPIAGRVSSARITAGNLVSSGGNGASTNATLLTTIVSLNPIYCYVGVDERSALKYRDLQRSGKRKSAIDGEIPALMGLANQTGYPHVGVIDFVDNAFDPASGTIRARGVFKNDDGLMAPGFFARLRIPGSGEYDAMLVRDAAINSDQGRSYVLTVDGAGKVAYRTVVTGPLEDGLRIIREGLQADDRVIINGLMAARVGAAVNATEAPMAEPAPAPAGAPAK